MVLGRLAALILIFVVGVSLNLSWQKARDENRNLLKKFCSRSAGLFAIAALISFATWIYPNNGWIFWGIIHFIAFSVFACHFFAKYFKLNLVLGIASILLGFYLQNYSNSNIFLFIVGIPANFYTLDYFPIFPWIGVVFLGMFFSKAVYIKKVFGKMDFIFWKIPCLKIFEAAGRNSLLIYLLHQPLLVGAIFLLKLFFG